MFDEKTRQKLLKCSTFKQMLEVLEKDFDLSKPELSLIQKGIIINGLAQTVNLFRIPKKK